MNFGIPVTNNPPKGKSARQGLFSLLLATSLLTLSGGAIAQIEDTPDFDANLDDNLDIPVVLTASRLKQSKADTPATVTIIKGSTIRQLGLTTLPQVFRLVPGMTLGYVESNVPVVSYHGTVANEQRRLQVLIDGRSHYNPNLAEVDWHNLPVAMENIDRIEVTRGPNAVTYGSNSYLAIINIITLHPEDTQGFKLRAVDGSEGFLTYFGSYGGNTRLKGADYEYRLSFKSRQSNGFDFRFENPFKGASEVKVPFNDGYDLDTVNYDSILTLDDKNTIIFNTAYQDSLDEVAVEQFGAEFGILNDPNIKGHDVLFQTKWVHRVNENHEFHIQAYYQKRNRKQHWRSELDLSLFDSSFPAGTTFQTDADQDKRESRSDFEFQDTVTLSPKLRAVWGLNYREDKYESETFFRGKGSSYLGRFFTNVEYRPTHWLTSNFGFMRERDTQNKNLTSPRLAFNFHLDEQQTIRFILSKAYRTPDGFEQSADWHYDFRNVSPDAFKAIFEGQPSPFQFAAPGGLHEETIISREISYYGLFNVAEGALSTEVKFYHDSLKDVIGGRISITNWDLDNAINMVQQGVELETSFKKDEDEIRLSYAYIDQDAVYTGPNTETPTHGELPPHRFIALESRLTAQHTGSFYWIHQFPEQISGSLVYYIADQLNEWDFQRLDARVSKQVRLNDYEFEIAAIAQHSLNGNPILHRDNQLSDRSHFFVEASADF